MNEDTMSSIKNMLQTVRNCFHDIDDVTREFEADGKIHLFHPHVNGHPNYGIFRVERKKGGYSIFVVFTTYDKNDSEMYRMHIFSGDRTEALGEFHKTENERGTKVLCLRYKPAKRDGRNPKRKEVFEKLYGKLSVGIPIQSDSLLNDLFFYAENRSKADNL